jgi:hypothetical protein
MNRLWVKIFLSFGIGVCLLLLWNYFMNISYNNVGSQDVISGAIIEFFLFTLLLELYQNKQAMQSKKELASHLKEIEKLLRSDKNDN